MNRDWDKLRRQDKVRKNGSSAIDSFKPKNKWVEKWIKRKEARRAKNLAKIRRLWG